MEKNQIPDTCYYSIYHYTDQIRKVIRFNRSVVVGDRFYKEKNESQHYDFKLDSSISRSRKIILEYALCNKWDWFCSFTLDSKKYDRYDLDKFVKSFTQFIRDTRKKGYPIKYLLIPERHKDGAWHMHGLMSDLPPLVKFTALRRQGRKVPSDLCKNDFYCWLAVSDKFGWCSLGKIRSPVKSAFYTSKYMTKDNDFLVTDLGKHMVLTSRNLNRASKIGVHYTRSDELDQYITHNYKFCSLGMTKVGHNLSWHSLLDLIDDPELPLDDYAAVMVKVNDPEYIQLSLDGAQVY